MGKRVCAKVGLIGHGDQTFEGFVGLETSAGTAGIGDMHIRLCAAPSPARSGDTWVSAGWNSLEAHAVPHVNSGFFPRPFAFFYWGTDLNQSVLEMDVRVAGGTLHGVLKKYFWGTLKGQTELHPSRLREEPQAGRHLERPLNPCLYRTNERCGEINVILSELYLHQLITLSQAFVLGALECVGDNGGKKEAVVFDLEPLV